MKIIHITASYKPAYIYGGPIMSVAKLCEGLVEKGTRSNEQGLNNEHEFMVFTTTANGKNELQVQPGKVTLVDQVPVTYFKRLTKDHTHFSPALLWNLRKVLRQAQNQEQGVKNKEQRIKSKEQEVGYNNEESNREILREAQNDKKMVLHIHAWWNLVSIFSCLVAKHYKVPVILSPRGMLTQYTQQNRNNFTKKIIHNLIGKRLLSYCQLHATSEQEKQDILKIIKHPNITVIPNLVDLGLRNKEQRTNSNEQRVKNEDQRAKTKEQGLKNQEQGTNSKDEPTTINEKQSTVKERTTNNEQPPFKIIFLSRIEEKKGLKLLIEALADLNINWSLTIAGSGEEGYVKKLKLKAESLKVAAKINWLGQVCNDEKFELLAMHDIMALTSYNENFANVVIESLSVGTPVLLSKEVGLADYVLVKKLGWVGNLNNKSISENLTLAYANISVRQRIRVEAPQIIDEDFDDLRLIKKYVELYEKVNNGRL